MRLRENESCTSSSRSLPIHQPHSYHFDSCSLVIAFRYTDRIITLSFCCYALDGCRVVVVSYRHSEPINEYEDKTTSSLLSDLTNSPWLYSTTSWTGV